MPLNFFNQIERYIENWGVQYFLSNFFNQKLGGNVVKELISRIEKAYSVSFDKSLDHFSFHVSGNDSNISSNLRERFSEVFPSCLNGQFATVDDLIAQSDLCLILSNSQNVKVGLFGEIEGIYGNKLRTESYWVKKHDFCIFGIGVVDGSQKVVYFQEGFFNGIYRINLFFERTNFVVTDYKIALGAIKRLFLEGPGAIFYSQDEEFEFFLNKIKIHWSSNMNKLMDELKLFISPEDVVGFNGGVLEIVTDLQSAPKG